MNAPMMSPMNQGGSGGGLFDSMGLGGGSSRIGGFGGANTSGLNRDFSQSSQSGGYTGGGGTLGNIIQITNVSKRWSMLIE